MSGPLSDRLRHVLWIGGAQWAGKTTVAQALADEFRLALYEYDLHDARDHYLRAQADRTRWPVYGTAISPDERWLAPAPQLVERAEAVFDERWAMVLEDLLALPPTRRILAEGFGLRPRHVAGVIRSPRQAAFLVPSAELVELQKARLDRAMSSAHLGTSDPEQAHAHRLERDRILAERCVSEARHLRLRVVTVTPDLDSRSLGELLATHFDLK